MKRVVAIGIPVLLLGGLVTWRIIGKKSQDASLQQGQQSRQRSAPSVDLGSAGPKLIEETLDTVGSVEAPFNVKIASQVAGRIDLLQVREGDPVTIGQVLVRIDPSEVEGQVLQQQAAVAEAQSRLAQAQLTQGSTNVGISSQIRQQQAAVSSARADLNQVSQNYSAQIATAQSAVTDAEARVAAARAAVDRASAGVASAKAKEANAQTKFDRTNSLYKQGFVAAQDVDDAKTTLQVQQSAVQVAIKQQSSAESALHSAQAVQKSAEQQVSIAKRKGRSDIADAQAKVKQAQANLDVAVANQSQGPAYQANLAALQSSVSAAVAQLRQAEARRAYTVIKSPIEGTVTSRQMDPGANATPGAEILTVQYLKWVYVTTTVPVDQSGAVRQGMLVAISFDSLDGKKVNGSVTEINKSADPQNRQFTVRIRLDNPGTQLRPGMFAHITFTVSSVKAAVAIPREAVQQKPDGAHVFTVDSESVAHDTTVVLGASDAKSYEVKSGLKPGDKVVVLSYTPVKDGQKVRDAASEKKSGAPGGSGKGQGRRGATP